MIRRGLHSRWARGMVVLFAAAGVVALLWWRGPAWSAVGHAFDTVEWRWVTAAVGLNLLSVLVRALAWRTVIVQATPPPHPPFRLVFSAFSVGLFGNAVLPGRIGELARVAVLTRRMPEQQGAWALLLGTVFAHRVFDLVAATALIIFVVSTAHIPDWAVTSLIVVVVTGVALLSIAVLSARRGQLADLGGLGAIRKLVRLVRHGLGVMREPRAAALACFFQILGWTCQLLAVWTAMRAFHIYKPLPAAGLVLVLMNVATIFPLWPGNIGLVQAAIAIPLHQYYNVARATGIAYGFGLQAIEASVGVGVGLMFLAREGLSFAMLRVMPDASQAEIPDDADQRERAAAAAALAEGLRSWADVDELPVADGGEGTLEVLQAALGGAWHDVAVHDAFGRLRWARWLELPDGTAAVEAAEAIPLDPSRLDPFAASSRGLGEVIHAVGRGRELLVCLGGTANVDGGAGLLEVIDALPNPTRVACDVDVPLVDAARVFAAQKGATPEDARALELRLLAMEELRSVADRPGAGAAGGLGAALAALGAELLPGAALVLDAIGFDAAGYDLVVTGEGTVDATTMRGKAPGEVVRRCERADVRRVLFAGRVVEAPPGVETVALSGDPSRAHGDLVELGARLRAGHA